MVAATVPSIPILTAATSRSSSTASICAANRTSGRANVSAPYCPNTSRLMTPIMVAHSVMAPTITESGSAEPNSRRTASNGSSSSGAPPSGISQE